MTHEISNNYYQDNADGATKYVYISPTSNSTYNSFQGDVAFSHTLTDDCMPLESCICFQMKIRKNNTSGALAFSSCDFIGADGEHMAPNLPANFFNQAKVTINDTVTFQVNQFAQTDSLMKLMFSNRQTSETSFSHQGIQLIPDCCGYSSVGSPNVANPFYDVYGYIPMGTNASSTVTGSTAAAQVFTGENDPSVDINNTRKKLLYGCNKNKDTINVVLSLSSLGCFSSGAAIPAGTKFDLVLTVDGGYRNQIFCQSLDAYTGSGVYVPSVSTLVDVPAHAFSMDITKIQMMLRCVRTKPRMGRYVTPTLEFITNIRNVAGASAVASQSFQYTLPPSCTKIILAHTYDSYGINRAPSDFSTQWNSMANTADSATFLPPPARCLSSLRVSYGGEVYFNQYQLACNGSDTQDWYKLFFDVMSQSNSLENGNITDFEKFLVNPLICLTTTRKEGDNSNDLNIDLTYSPSVKNCSLIMVAICQGEIEYNLQMMGKGETKYLRIH